MSSEEHSFSRRPHRTLLALSLTVLISLVAEPFTGLVDTFFVARLGALELAALGVAAVMLSSVFWLFNFLGIGTQTEVARSYGAADPVRAREASTLALALGLLLGVALAAVSWPWLEAAARWMGADASMSGSAVAYLRVRLLGGPATLMMIAAFGALRGLQDMRTPLRIALASNALNIVLDPLLIFGWGFVPALGVAGAAWASTVSQYLAALWGLLAVRRRLGLTVQLHWREAARLLRVGRDLFLRTGLLLLFLLLATRVATQSGAATGAAHQAIRQVWLLTALALDALAMSAQSLVGYFMGAGSVVGARRVARVACQWGLIAGVLLSVCMLGLEGAVATGLVPPPARSVFILAWRVSALTQPLAALSFVTDGVHWGTADYRYLRNAMLLATGLGIVVMLGIDPRGPAALTWVWATTAGWLLVRAFFGVARIWPGLGHSPLRIARD